MHLIKIAILLLFIFTTDNVLGQRMEKRKRDSLKSTFITYPIETNKYIAAYLARNEIIPNEDAIELLRKMNPTLVDMIFVTAYIELRMPTFRKSKSVLDSLKKSRRIMNRFDKEAQAVFKEQFDNMQEAVKLYRNKSNEYTATQRKKEFDQNLDLIQKYLVDYVKRRLMKGTAIFATKQIYSLTELLRDVNSNNNILERHFKLMNEIKSNLYCPCVWAPHYFYEDLRFIPNDRQGLFEVSQVSDEISAYPPLLIGDAKGISGKLCEIYAKKPSADGGSKDVDIENQYFFSIKTFAEAVWLCRTGTCTGFNEEPGLVSFNGVNIIPGSYVALFRDKDTGKMYSRCITKEQFDLISAMRSNSPRRYRLIFNPESNECTDHLKIPQ